MGRELPKINKQYKFVFFTLFLVALIALAAVFLNDKNISVMNPAGTIANKQRDLIVFTTLLGLFVVIPVFVMTFYISWKYRASNKKARYSPEWDHHRVAESVWWGLPLLIILVLSVVTWKSTHELDPYKPLESSVRPVTIQVVALEWKWLFIYPEENIATVNYIRIPEDTPINFEITADAPMNSFWIPQLGGQVYAMSGMKTKLHLMANEQGSYTGSSANLSGQGFASMKFIAESTSDEDYRSWIGEVRGSENYLTLDLYGALAAPSENNEIAYYGGTDETLYDKVIMKYMGTDNSLVNTGHTSEHDKNESGHYR